MASHTSKVAEALRQAGLVDERKLRLAQARLDAHGGGRIAHALVELGYLSEEQVVETLAERLGVPRIWLGSISKEPKALAKLGLGFAEQSALFPVQLKENGKALLLAMADPSDQELLDEAARRAKLKIIPAISGEKEILAAISLHYRGTDPAEVQKQFGPFPAPKRHTSVTQEAELLLTEVDQAPPPGTTAQLLEEILSGPTVLRSQSEEEAARIEAAKVNQEKSAKIVRAVMELLFEKGVLSREELRGRLR